MHFNRQAHTVSSFIIIIIKIKSIRLKTVGGHPFQFDPFLCLFFGVYQQRIPQQILNDLSHVQCEKDGPLM